jgi:branched-chain amino acid transport system ATP-binding protein
VLRYLDLIKLYDRPASDISGGQMKLLELGRSLMGAPTLLLLDEPTAGVAPRLAYTIFEHIEHLRRTLGLTFLIVEHRLEILFDFVDTVYVMHLGRLIAQGTPAEISANTEVREIYFGE